MSQHNKQTPPAPPNGQALVEYSLILVLVILGFGLALAATGPTIANVFSNTVFNLVSRESDKVGGKVTPPNVAAFWQTVTAVASYTPAEVPLPTSTQQFPTNTPTPGPPPPPTDTLVPTPITPTLTPQPSPTVVDFAVVAPWTDTANDKIYWRLDEFNPLGTENWLGTYYTGTTLTGQPFLVSRTPTLFYDWTNKGPSVASGDPVDNFSATWTRTIYLETEMQITFKVPKVDDGIRIFVLGSSSGSTVPGCSTKYKGDGSWVVVDDAALSYNFAADPKGLTIPNECLILDHWNGGSGAPPKTSITRTFKRGYYQVRVDYQEFTGAASVDVGLTTSSNRSNPDDAVFDASNKPITYLDTTAQPNKTANVAANCDWGNPTGLEKFADTPDKLWNSYEPDSAFRGSRLCYLEFRGSIEIPTAMTAPTLTFWDLWDFQIASSAWVEVSEYNADRSLLVWDKFPLHKDDTFNFNWTYQTVTLPVKYVGKKIALRFAMQNTSTTVTSRWWVDTITIDNLVRPTLFMAKKWDLNDKNQAKDFIASGNWGLTSENAIGATGFGWHESPDVAKYTKIDVERGVPPTDSRNFRIHSLELNGFVDLDSTSGLIDLDGDNGEPELTFYHAYDLANLTGLEVQYTADPYSYGDGAKWTTLNSMVSRTGTGPIALNAATQVRVALQPIADAGIRKFRVRFAMLVDKDSTADKSGWWIDNISLERVDRPRFTAYPFIDRMDDSSSDVAWQSLDTWAREAGPNPQGGASGFSWTDSPGANYLPNDQSIVQLRYPLDLRADTITNPRSPQCKPLGPKCNTVAQGQDKPSVNPMMTFWWKRTLGAGTSLLVEWKLKTASPTAWNTLWAYDDGMQTVGNSMWTETRDSRAWERVVIDMKPLTNALANVAGDDSEDDIMLRFNLKTGGSNTTGPGVWIDNVEISDRLDVTWSLWPTSELRTDSTGAALQKGNGITYTNSGEDINVYPPEWYLGGNWDSINWESQDGLSAFHDSVNTNGTTQSVAEVGYNDNNLAMTQGNSFNALELNNIFDLRGVNATERPIMYFWSRYAVPSGGTIKVQIATEKPAASPSPVCMNTRPQCYDKIYGWNEWTDVWTVTGAKKNLAWNREQVSLVSYAKNGVTPGSRIRIRFLVDALTMSSNADGWYLDDFTLTYYTERRIAIDASNSFIDNSTDLSNWVAEGFWGLDPDLYRGGGGTPVSLGPSWTVNYWDFSGTAGNTRCQNVGFDNGGNLGKCVKSFFEPGTGGDPNRAKSMTGSSHRPNSTGINRDQPGIDIEIFHEWFGGGPFGYTDNFAGRWELVSNIVGSPGTPKGKVTFIMASDDGARLKYVNEQASNINTDACWQVTTTCSFDPNNRATYLTAKEWNIIDNFLPSHGRIVNVGTAVMAVAGAGGNNNTSGRYRFILEYYEKTGDATITLSTGADTFSFSDSPKQGTGSSFPEVPAIRNASSSLILNGVLDLTKAVNPYMTYYTYYELGGTARVEVSIDGGFTWTQVGLGGTLDNNKWVKTGSPATTAPWQVDMFFDKDLDYTGGGPNYTTTTTNIDYTYGGTTLLFGQRSSNLSVRFTRKINLITSDILNFNTIGDDGIRLWVYKDGVESPQTPSPTNGCRTGNASPVYIRSGQPKTNSNSVFTDGCLLIDNWQDQGPNSQFATFKPASNGVYVIQLDHYQGGGGAQVTLNITPGTFSAASFTNTVMPVNGDTSTWQFRSHDLSAYIGQRIGLRFRLDRLGILEDDPNNPNRQNYAVQKPYDYLVSWWITEISVFGQ